MFYKIVLLKNFGKLLGKHLCQNFFLDKVAHIKPATLLRGDFSTDVLLWILWKCWGHFIELLRWVLLISIRPSWPLGRGGGVCLHFPSIAFFGCLWATSYSLWGLVWLAGYLGLWFSCWVARSGKGLICILQEFSSSIDKAFILAGGCALGYYSMWFREFPDIS